MKVEVQELTPVKRAIKVEIPQEVVSQEFAQAYALLRQRVKIPGFRPGKAPLSLLERRFGREVEEDVVQKLIPDYYRRALQEAGLTPVELPAIEKISIKKDAPLSFLATVEIRPKIGLIHYTGTKVIRKPITVTDQDVEKALSHLQHQHSQLESHEPERRIQTGDYVIMDFEGFLGEMALTDAKAEGFVLEVGSKTVFPEIEDTLVGRKQGETFEADLTLPRDHQNPQWAGKAILFKIKIHEVKRKVLPSLGDDFAKEMGLGTLVELRTKLRAEIENRLRTERTSAEKEHLVKQLIAEHVFQAPPSMVERELEDILYRLENQGRASGSTAQETSEQLKVLHAEYRPIAEDRAKGRILLQCIAEQEGISVDPQEVEQEIAQMARGLRTTVQEVKKWILSRQGSLEGLKTKLLERKALDFIYSKAVFVEE